MRSRPPPKCLLREYEARRQPPAESRAGRVGLKLGIGWSKARMLRVVVSHPSAENAEGWATRPPDFDVG